MQFARVAHATGFVYCYSIMDANRRSDYAPSPPSSHPHASGGGASAAGRPRLMEHAASVASELNTFFPFDPYKLPRSGSYIQGVYREWSAVAIDEDDESDDEEDEHESGNSSLPLSSYSYDGLSSPLAFRPQRDSEADQLGASFGGMSISPAHAPISISLSSVMSVS